MAREGVTRGSSGNKRAEDAGKSGRKSSAGGKSKGGGDRGSSSGSGRTGRR